MKAYVKIGLVVAGYVLAGALAVVAVLAVGANSVFTSGPAGQASSGMAAFGDAILFLIVFGVAAVPVTGAALYFLKPYRAFWLALSVLAFGILSTGLAAFVACFAKKWAGSNSLLNNWDALISIRVLAAPVFAVSFLLSGIFAPSRSHRIALLLAAFLEAAVFVSVVAFWILSNRGH